jgi:hypothetical protein
MAILNRYVITPWVRLLMEANLMSQIDFLYRVSSSRTKQLSSFQVASHMEEAAPWGPRVNELHRQHFGLQLAKLRTPSFQEA